MIFSFKTLLFNTVIRKQISKTIKSYTLFLLLFFSILPSFSQSDSLNNILEERLQEIDQKIDTRDYDIAKELIKKVDDDFKELTTENKFAIDLRILEVQYYADKNQENIDLLLNNLDKIKAKNSSQLYFKYNSFIGQVFKTSSNFERAIFYHKQALLNAEKRNDSIDIIFSCLKLGKCYYRVNYIDTPKYYKNQVDSALFYYNKALRIPENRKNRYLFSRIYDNLSRIEITKGNLDNAEAYANKALSINKKNDNSFGVGVSLSNLGNIYYQKKKYEKAIKIAKESTLSLKNKSLMDTLD